MKVTGGYGVTSRQMEVSAALASLKDTKVLSEGLETTLQ